MKNITVSFNILRLDLYVFYLVTLPLSITWAPMKYHIKPLGMTKSQGFRQNLLGKIYFYNRRNYVKPKLS